MCMKWRWVMGTRRRFQRGNWNAWLRTHGLSASVDIVVSYSRDNEVRKETCWKAGTGLPAGSRDVSERPDELHSPRKLVSYGYPWHFREDKTTGARGWPVPRMTLVKLYLCSPTRLHDELLNKGTTWEASAPQYNFITTSNSYEIFGPKGISYYRHFFFIV
jgi:hypothetical protein